MQSIQQSEICLGRLKDGPAIIRDIKDQNSIGLLKTDAPSLVGNIGYFVPSPQDISVVIANLGSIYICWYVVAHILVPLRKVARGVYLAILGGAVSLLNFYACILWVRWVVGSEDLRALLPAALIFQATLALGGVLRMLKVASSFHSATGQKCIQALSLTEFMGVFFATAWQEGLVYSLMIFMMVSQEYASHASDVANHATRIIREKSRGYKHPSALKEGAAGL